MSECKVLILISSNSVAYHKFAECHVLVRMSCFGVELGSFSHTRRVFPLCNKPVGMNFVKIEKLQPGITDPVIFFKKIQPKSIKVVA